jgi:hypothetical protein
MNFNKCYSKGDLGEMVVEKNDFEGGQKVSKKSWFEI